MGRKRRNRNSVKGTDAIKSAQYREEMLELLVSIHDMGCFSATAESSRVGLVLRKRLILCLNKLLSSIEAYTRARRDCLSPYMSAGHDGMAPSQQRTDDHRLVLLEKAAIESRSICNDYVGILAEEQAELSQLSRQLENLCREQSAVDNVQVDPFHAVQVTLFVRSLVSQYQAQLNFEEKLANVIITFLSNLYDGETNSTFETTRGNAAMIRNWSQCLDERPYLKQLYWNNLPDLIGMFQQSNHSTRTNTASVGLMQACPSNDQVIHEAVRSRSDLRTCVLAEQTITGAVDVFLRGKSDSEDATFTFLLLVGSPGSGKTHLCDQIAHKISKNASGGVWAPDSIKLIRPLLPLDVMGSSIGEAEDIVVSLFGCIRGVNKKCVVILDDVQHLIGDDFAGPSGLEYNNISIDEGKEHVTVRARSTLLAIMNLLRVKGPRQNQTNDLAHETMVICTASHAGDESIGQFDKVFILQPPDEEERRNMISSSLGINSLKPTGQPNDEVDALLTDLVEITIGRSYAEIAQYCRGASSAVVGSSIEFSNENEKEVTRHLCVLRAMKESLRNMAPESLRTGSLDDIVDVNMYSARELLADKTFPLQQLQLPFPLFGDDAKEAWRQMDGLIVTPLCRARSLDEIMYGCSRSSGRAVCAGVLLTGPPGCGKSVLGRHCAQVCASLLNSVTLLDVSCTSLVHKEVGGSERAVQRLFSAARAAAPCILLMDGIENIAAIRGNDNTTEGTMDRVLSTLLTELDGIDNDPGSLDARRSGGIVVIGITHNPAWIDPALRRPGRLEKVIRLLHPDNEARRLIVLNQIERLPIDFSSEDSGVLSTPRNIPDLAEFVSSRCHHMSGAEVIAVCNDACVLSARRHMHHVETTSKQTIAMITIKDFVSAIDFRKKGSPC